MIFEKYYSEVVDVLDKIKNTQSQKIASAAEQVAKTIENAYLRMEV